MFKLTRFTALLTAFILSFTLPSFATDLCSHLLMGGVPITQTALEAIHGAKSDYDIEVLSKVVNGKPHFVILAGETHVKRKNASDAGVRLIKQFNFRGLEGADPEKNGIAGKLISPVLDAMDFIAQKLLRLRGSTIADAWNEDYLRLEEGHKPGLTENLNMLQITATLGFSGLVFGLWPFEGHGYYYVDVASQIVNVIVNFNLVYVFAEMGLQKKYEGKRWFNILFPLHGGIINGRNATMVGNIEKGFRDHPEADQMIVIIGRAHVRGMKQLLIEDYGYASSEIPELPIGEESAPEVSRAQLR